MRFNITFTMKITFSCSSKDMKFWDVMNKTMQTLSDKWIYCLNNYHYTFIFSAKSNLRIINLYYPLWIYQKIILLINMADDNYSQIIIWSLTCCIRFYERILSIMAKYDLSIVSLSSELYCFLFLYHPTLGNTINYWR